MKHSNKTSSLSTARAPYAPATRLVEIPIVLFEILELASESLDERGKQIVPLIQSVIKITQEQPDALAHLPYKAESAPVGESGNPLI